MINLLPPTMKDGYRYARHNRRLLHWVIALGIGIIGAVALTTIGYLYMDETAKSYEMQIATTQEQLNKQNYTGIKKEVKDITNNLQLVVQVLSNQVVFSDLLTQLGSLTPKDTVLTGLSIAQTQGAINITAQAKDYSSATQLHINLSDANNKIFSKADIVSIDCQQDSKNTYPCTITVRALFAPDNPYLFINQSKVGAKS